MQHILLGIVFDWLCFEEMGAFSQWKATLKGTTYAFLHNFRECFPEKYISF